MELQFICTGGTIDKDYAPSAGTYNFEISNPAIHRILSSARLNINFEISSILKKDSLDLTDKDRELVYNTCLNSQHKKIIITHGTDTMIKTASKLNKIKDKVIVLFGSSRPEKFYGSDAHVNLGVAIGAINLLNEGVYIAMNGRIYEWNKCEKRKEDGMFIEKI